jgi:hypothetical protein
MARFSRMAGAKTIEAHSIERPFSNFSFVDLSFSEYLWSLRRILSQVRQHDGKTMLVEEIDIADADDLSEENEDIALRIPSFCDSKAWRLTFFAAPLLSEASLDSLSPEAFLGYAIVKRDILPSPFGRAIVRVYESVVKSSRHDNNFIRGSQSWTCHANSSPFTVDGYLYAQQNDLTNTCAHVAVRTLAASFHKDGDMTYREINTRTGLPDLDIPPVDHVTRKAGKIGGADPSGFGLHPTEMQSAIEAAGARCVRVEYVAADDPPPPPFEKYVYGSIESGYPAIVGFETGGDEQHAIPIFGHTFNDDTWVPPARLMYFQVGPNTAYIPSDSWLSAFVGHDDNCGSNYCIPRHFLSTRPYCDHASPAPGLCQSDIRGVTYVIGTFPQEVVVDSDDAELIGVDCLSPLLEQMPTEDQAWAKRLKLYWGNHLLVFRPILVDADKYIRHLTRITDWRYRKLQEKQIDTLRTALPQARPIWMVELSLPELFSANKRKIGEVLIVADVKAQEDRGLDSFILARLPSHFALLKSTENEAYAPDTPPFRFVPSGLCDHVELYGCEEH